MVTTLFYKTKLQKVLYIIAPILFVVGCLGEAYYAIGVRIPVLSSLIAAGDWFEWFRRIFSMGIPFFCLGGLLSTKVGFMERLKPKTTWWILACTVLLYFAELIAVTHMGLAKGFIISLFLYPLLAAIFIVLFKNPLSSLSSLGAFSRYASGLVYYIHPAIILVANALLLTHTLKFLFVSVVCLVISLITYRISFMRKIV